MALPFYALTLFVSAFILFLVQPIVGKIILPKLGGTPQVWNTCMVFFQMVLLAGYAYTHNASTRLNLRQQLIAHAVLLLLPLIVLLPFPFAFGGEFVTVDGATIPNPNSLWGFLPDLGSNPIPSTLTVLFMYVALPFVVVATSAPLLQKWFVHTGHPAAKDPYFLYGASNFGSMLSLMVYPTLIEPNVTLKHQGYIYTFGYLALVAFVVTCAAMVWNSKEKPHAAPDLKPQPKPDAAPEPTPAPAAADTGVAAGAPPAATGVKPGQPKHTGKHGGGKPAAPVIDSPIAMGSDEVTAGRRFRWVMLAAIPSSLMLGITTHITTDLSPIPLFWLIPLILYLLSFILVFAKWPVVWTEEPHKFVLYAQPFCVALMIIVDVFNLFHDTRAILFAIIAHVLGFFATTMMCHGEMAKDRPSTRHLTEFFLWMSVGGMVGGMFNALIAPVIFWKNWEFPLAIFAAVIVRPKMMDTGFLDSFFASLFEGQPEAAARPAGKGQKAAHPVSTGLVAPNENTTKNLDFAWAIGILALTVVLAMVFDSARGTSPQGKLIAYGVPLSLACLQFARPLRVGLGIGFVLLVNTVLTSVNDEASRYASRSYFGTIAVKESQMRKDKEGKIILNFHRLIHGHIDHGMNFLRPTSKSDYDVPDKDYSRLATTYYHREGPEGRVMEKFNWFPDEPDANTYRADARLPVSLVGSTIADVLGSGLPIATMVSAWSEPPIATIGLGTGTMASYGRVYQHVHFYEIDDQIRRLSLLVPTRLCGTHESYLKAKQGVAGRQVTYFSYLENALERGSSVQVLMGDARLRMALPYKNHYTDTTEHGGGPRNFYQMMVVDAFSSDAIPAHLLTKQAFQMYFDKLTEDGILCVHTSNRFVDLPKVVSALSAAGIEVDEVVDGKVVKKIQKLAHRRGHDSNDLRENGHYTSEWVMVARKDEYLQTGTVLANKEFKCVPFDSDTTFLKRYEEAMTKKTDGRAVEPYWTTIRSEDRYVWTDDYYNILSVVRFR